MIRVAAVLHLVTGSAISGSFVIAALVMGVTSMWTIFGLAVAGYIAAAPLSYYIARAITGKPKG